MRIQKFLNPTESVFLLRVQRTLNATKLIGLLPIQDCFEGFLVQLFREYSNKILKRYIQSLSGLIK
jgi:hypothetical protein